MVTLKLITFDSGGSETSRTWTFEPLTNKRHKRYHRESRESAGFRSRRRPYARKRRLLLTVSAAVLKVPAHKEGFECLLDAQKIYLKEEVNGKDVWTEFGFDNGADVEYQYREDADRWPYYELTLIESQAIPFSKFSLYK